MLASALSELLPLIFLAKSLQCIPEDLRQQMPARDAFSASNDSMWCFKGSKNAPDNCRFAGRGDTMNNYSRRTRYFWLKSKTEKLAIVARLVVSSMDAAERLT